MHRERPSAGGSAPPQYPGGWWGAGTYTQHLTAARAGAGDGLAEDGWRTDPTAPDPLALAQAAGGGGAAASSGGGSSSSGRGVGLGREMKDTAVINNFKRKVQSSVVGLPEMEEPAAADSGQAEGVAGGGGGGGGGGGVSGNMTNREDVQRQIQQAKQKQEEAKRRQEQHEQRRQRHLEQEQQRQKKQRQNAKA